MVRKRVLNPKPIFDEGLLREFFDRHDVKEVHMGRIWKYVISHPDCALSEIPKIPDKIRAPLAKEFVVCTSTVSKYMESEIDHTVKLLVRLQDGAEIEAVMINHTGEPDDGPESAQKERCGARNTLCISSQVGCALRCSFCATGTMGLHGNLLSGEIIEQIWHATRYREIQNVVYMGMGEPLENYEAVVSSIRGLVDPQRFGLAPRSVTVSTVGIIDKMKRLMRELPQIKLALSLHAPNQELREQLVPVCKDRGVHLDDLMRTIDDYAAKTTSDGKRKGMVMVSYVLLKGVNDTDAHAEQLRDLLKDRPVIVNLIPYNPFEGNKFDYETTEPEQVDRLLQTLIRADIRVFERRHHGRDIAAACGQLAKISKTSATADIEACDCSLAKDRISNKQQQALPSGAKPWGQTKSGAPRCFEPKSGKREERGSEAPSSLAQQWWLTASLMTFGVLAVGVSSLSLWRRSSLASASR